MVPLTPGLLLSTGHCRLELVTLTEEGWLCLWHTPSGVCEVWAPSYFLEGLCPTKS